MQTAIGYVRVSTAGQATEVVSLEAQRAKIEAWCLANDVQLAGLFVDAGISGKRADNRPELQTALNAVTKSKGVLVVYSLSRLARSTKDTITISEELDELTIVHEASHAWFNRNWFTERWITEGLADEYAARVLR